MIVWVVFNEQYLVVWWLLNERGLLILRFDVKKQIVFECKMTVGDRILTPGGAAELMRGVIEPVLLQSEQEQLVSFSLFLFQLSYVCFYNFAYKSLFKLNAFCLN